MSITIGGVLLDHPMYWSDEYNWVPTVGVANRTIEGRAVSQAYEISGDRPMTLVGDANHGWQTRATVVLLQALADDPTASYTLDFHGDNYTVRFAHEDAPALNFAPVTLVEDPGDPFWYTGTINLRIVG